MGQDSTRTHVRFYGGVVGKRFPEIREGNKEWPCICRLATSEFTLPLHNQPFHAGLPERRMIEGYILLAFRGVKISPAVIVGSLRFVNCRQRIIRAADER